MEVTEVKVRVPVGNVSIYKYVVSTSTSSTSTVVLVVVQVPGSVGTRDKVPGYTGMLFFTENRKINKIFSNWYRTGSFN